ncbi:hypothetical protein TCSYLVIO_009628, partial [Trypanosoma cruzi]
MGGPQSYPPRWLLHAARGPCETAWCPLDPRPVVLRCMEALFPCPLGSAVLRYSWERVCALPPPQTLPDLNTATPCRPTSGWLTSSCPLLGRPARSLQIASNSLCWWCCPPTLKRQDRPDLLRNLHLACPRHLLVERRAADQRRPAKAAAASSRSSTIRRHTPDALSLALQSLRKASHADRATAPRSSQQVPHAQFITENVKRVNEQKTDNTPLQAPMTAVALQPLLYCNHHQPRVLEMYHGRPRRTRCGNAPAVGNW